MAIRSVGAGNWIASLSDLLPRAGTIVGSRHSPLGNAYTAWLRGPLGGSPRRRSLHHRPRAGGSRWSSGHVRLQLRPHDRIRPYLPDSAGAADLPVAGNNPV